jgi:sugar phosphate isomerase/epimerase
VRARIIASAGCDSDSRQVQSLRNPRSESSGAIPGGYGFIFSTRPCLDRLANEGGADSGKARKKEQTESGIIKAIPSLSPEEFQYLREGDFDEIELMLFDKNISNWRMNEVFCELYDLGVRAYSVHLPNFTLNKPNSRQVGRFREFIDDVSAIFHPSVMVLHSLYGGISELVTNLQNIAKGLPYGMKLAIENLPRSDANISGLDSLRSFFSAFPRIPENLRFCLDTTHLATSVPEAHTDEIIQLIRASSEFLAHTHLSDKLWKPGAPEANPEGWLQHVPLGQGITDWKKVKSALSAQGYEGRVVLEYNIEKKNLLAEGVRFWESL